MNPSQLLYTATHEWVYVSESGGEKLATVGLTQYAVESLTDLIFLELPQPGQQVQAGKPLGVVESVKAVSDIYSPVDGEVIEANTALIDQLDRLSQDPYGDGWLVKIRLTGSQLPSSLLDYEAYEKLCAESV